jgi:hypothetical protein
MFDAVMVRTPYLLEQPILRWEEFCQGYQCDYFDGSEGKATGCSAIVHGQTDIGPVHHGYL